MTSLECQCWINSQCSTCEHLELTDIPETSDNKTLENTILKIFERLKVKMDPSNAEDIGLAAKMVPQTSDNEGFKT